MSTLFLTAAEKKLFDALPKEVKGEWTVEEERMTFEDSPEKRQVRLRNMQLKHPKLASLRNRAKSLKSSDEFQKLSEEIDFNAVSEDDLMELYFAMGPNILSEIIGMTLSNVKTSDGFLGVVALTAIRHSLLVALSSSPAAL